MYKILVLLNTPWSRDNNNGNTYSNLFSDLPNVEIANIYCRYGMPDHNGVVSKYYQITESDLLHKKPGRVFTEDSIPETETRTEQTDEKRRYDFFRNHRWMIFFWARELIWKIGRWKSRELCQFIDEFQPDLLYLPMFDAGYMQDIALFLYDYTKAKTIVCFTDDIYSLHQISFSPLYWIDRFWKRKKLRAIVKRSQFLHVISDEQKSEYEEYFGKECRVFRKSMDFDDEKRTVHELHNPIRYVYTGNLGSNRWKTLATLGKVLDRNDGELLIYSGTPLDKKMKGEFESSKSIHFMGEVSSTECMRIQEEADVLVLAESDRLKDQRIMRLSLSTKVIDYLHTGNCLLVIGTDGQAGMEYLKRGKAAVCVTKIEDLESTVRGLDRDTIREYGERAWQFGKANHDKKKVKEIFYQDLTGGTIS